MSDPGLMAMYVALPAGTLEGGVLAECLPCTPPSDDARELLSGEPCSEC